MDDRYIAFIKELIDKTKSIELKWGYLDNKVTLYEGMNWVTKKENFVLFSSPKETIYPNFDTEKSFCVLINDTFIVLLTKVAEPTTLIVVPNTYKNIVTLTSEEYGEYITRLLNVIQSFFPDGEKFIEHFLDTSKPE